MYKVYAYMNDRLETAYFTDFQTAKDKGLKKLIKMVHNIEGEKIGQPISYKVENGDNEEVCIWAFFNRQKRGYIVIESIRLEEWM